MAGSIKDEKTYEALRDEGASKEKAARIANASANEGRDTVGQRGGGESGTYEDMTQWQLYEQAQKVGIEGRSDMSKAEMIDALRNH